MKDYGTATSSTTPFLTPASKSSESVPIPARKSSESVKHPMNVEEQAPLAELDRKKVNRKYGHR